MTRASRGSTWTVRTALSALAACAAVASASTFAAAAGAPANAARSRAAPVPAANFLVEWRIRPVATASGRGDVVVTSSGAATGGAGDGAVVVGTARAAAPQGLRVANGHEGEMRFDRSTTRTVYDMSYAATSSSEASTDATRGASGVSTGGAARSRSRSQDRGVAGHEVVVHRVDGLRVTPHWTRGDTLTLDVQLTHGAPTDGSGMSGADPSSTREFSVTSTVALSFAEWQTVATIGDGSEELQLRVTWH